MNIKRPKPRSCIGLLAGSLFCLSAMTLSVSQADISPNPSNAPQGTVLAAWTQITGNGNSSGNDDKLPLAGVARFVIQGINQACDQFYIANANANTQASNQERWSPLKFEARVYPALSTDSHSEKFPVTVCETNFNSFWSRAILRKNETDQYLWSPNSAQGPKIEFPTLYSVGRKNANKIRLASFGDTGCRDNGDQSCSSNNTWPLAALASRAANDNPDLVIHVGDYRYSNKKHSDRWEYWYEEFFYPFQALLLEAPLAAVRGNHEACDYGSTSDKKAPWGTGWFYLLQHEHNGSNTKNCSSDHDKHLPPWYFDVGVKSGSVSNPMVSDKHRFIFLDSSAGDKSSTLRSNIKTIIDWSNEAGVDSTWWTTHKPFWGVKSDVSGTKPEAIQTGLQYNLTKVIKDNNITSNCWPTDQLPCSLKTILSGHIHMLQRVKFYAKDSSSSQWIRPQQYVVGHGGVAIDDGFTARPCSFKLPESGDSELGTSLKAVNEWQTKFGYVTWDRPAPNYQAGWVSTRHYYDGSDQADNAPTPDNKTDYPTCKVNK